MGAFLKCCQILGVFGQEVLDGVVHHPRDGAVRRHSLEAEGPMDLGVEIDGCSLR